MNNQTAETLLLTGFGLWGNETSNSSWEAIRDLDPELPERWKVRREKLPVEWEKGPSILSDMIDGTIGAVICFRLAPHLALVSKTPGRVLIPLALVVIFAGTYAYKGNIEDIIILLIFSVLGISMRMFGYNTASLFLGYILGALFENYLFVSLQLGGALFFLRPICLFLIFFLIAFFLYSPVIDLIKSWFRKGGSKV